MKTSSRTAAVVRPSDRIPARIIISRFASERTAKATRETLALGEFCDLLLTHRVGRKNGAAWSPAVFKDDRRRNSNVESVALAVLDLDTNAPTVSEAIDRLRAAGLAGIVHTTGRHTVDEPRLRVVLFPTWRWRRVDYPDPETAKAAFKAGLKSIARRLEFGLDAASADPAHIFFTPRHEAGAPHDAQWQPGGRADVWPDPDEAGEGAVLAANDDEDDDWGSEIPSIPSDVISSAIDATPNDGHFDDYQTWFSYLCAVKNTLGEDGRDIAERWSDSWTGEQERGIFSRTWDSIKEDYSGRKAGLGTILAAAKRGGWIDPRNAALGVSPARAIADERAAGGDVWAGARHAERLRDKRLYIITTRQWLRWSGQSWSAQTSEDVTADGKETSAQILTAAMRVRSDTSDADQRLYRDALKLHKSLSRQAAMVEAARSEPGMSVLSPADFDRDPEIITVPNGVLHLRSGQLREARPHDHVSKLAGAHFDPTAEAPRFTTFLRTILPDPDVRDFLQRAVGYSLTGRVDEECIFVLYGTGANGKSVFGNILYALLKEYALTSGAALLTRGRQGNEGDRLAADMPGKRVALVNETAQGDLWDSERIKTLASREQMTVRRLYGEPFSFMPTAKIWLRTNHLPGSLDAGDGFWRRLHPIPFLTQIPPEERIMDLDRRIIADELAGVLNWAVEGAHEWFERGLAPPAAIIDIVKNYRDETDILGQWLAERTRPAAQTEVRVHDAWLSYQEFCSGSGVNPGSKPNFCRLMTGRGIPQAKSRKNGRKYRNLRLVSPLFDDADNDDDGI